MFWRKWLVRGLVFSLLGGGLAAGYLYQRWTNPAAMRRQVVAKLRELFPGAEVTLDAARLRLLGGIALNELRLTRRDDPDKTDFAYFPSAVLYHDKEQILNGKLSFRKVDLHRPRLRVIRDRNGRWNLVGISKAAPSGESLPTLVIHQGTVVLEDQLACPGSPPLEMTDVNLTLVNDPPATVTIEGSGRSELAGAVELSGSWQRDSGELALSVRADRIPVGPQLVRRLGCYCSELGGHARHLDGVGKLQVELAYHPRTVHPWSHNVHFQLSQGGLRHPLLPVSLDHLEAALRCRNGQVTVEGLSARAGPASVKLTEAWLTGTGGGTAFRCKGTVEHLPLSHDLFARLPEAVSKFEKIFRPQGVLSLDFDFHRDNGQWRQQRFHLRPEGIRATFLAPEGAPPTVVGFDYPLERLSGTLDMDVRNEHTQIDLVGYGGARPITLRGECRGKGANAAVKIDIAGKNIPLDEKLVQALPKPVQNVVRPFNLTGRADIEAHIRHSPGEAGFANRFLVHFHHGTLKWEPFSYPLGEVKGFLDIQPRHWELKEFQGTNKGGVFQARGRSYPPLPGHSPADARIAIEIHGDSVRLDSDLKEALGLYPGLTRAWETFAPTGGMNFTANIDRLPRQPQDLDVTVDVRGCSVVPKFFPFLLHDLSGRFRYCKNCLRVTGLEARHGQSVVKLPHAEVKIYPGSVYFAQLTDLEANPLIPDAAFQAALPGPLKKAWAGLHFEGPLALKTLLIIKQPEEPGARPILYWDGMAWFQNAAFQPGLPLQQVSGLIASRGLHNGQQLQGVSCNVELDKATLFGQPFHNVHTKLDVYENMPDVLVLGLKAPLFGGQVSGPMRIEMNSILRYEIDLTASEINLESFGRHNLGPGSQLSGIVGGRLHLTGKGTGISSLEGNGSLDMPRGHLYNLPLLLDLLKFLGLRWPDRTAFDQAHASFGIHGDRVHFGHLELEGNAISLHGEGDMNMDGNNVHLDFIPVWGRIEKVLPAVWQPLPSLIGKNLLKIEVRGKVGKDKDLKFHKKPVPGLLEPLLQMRDRFAIFGGPRKPPAVEDARQGQP